MRKVLLLATAGILAAVGLSAAGQTPQSPVKVVPVKAPAAAINAPKSSGGPVAYKEILNKYCITCHNEKAKIPAGAPLALDKVNLNDPGADAAVWEKVVRKLGVGAMPP